MGPPGEDQVTEDRISPATTDTAAQAGARNAEEIPQPHYIKKASELRLDFDKQGGLLPAIVQDHRTKELLMVGFMNPEAWEKTLRTGLVTFWSRTRQLLWTKGETSGNHLKVVRLWTDCDEDTILAEVEPKGPTCHTGARSCFFEEITVDA